jgi:hypothetical protein
MTLREFKEDIYEALAKKPRQYRKGQFVFNYIDKKYERLASEAKRVFDVDCYYDDVEIYPFIVRCWQILPQKYKEE